MTAANPEQRPATLFGHPTGLFTLFFAEMWERFSYYGMRALLAVYVATMFFGHLGDQANAQAILVYGGYTALVYATGIIGGYIADHGAVNDHDPRLDVPSDGCAFVDGHRLASHNAAAKLPLNPQ